MGIPLIDVRWITYTLGVVCLEENGRNVVPQAHASGKKTTEKGK